VHDLELAKAAGRPILDIEEFWSKEQYILDCADSEKTSPTIHGRENIGRERQSGEQECENPGDFENHRDSLVH
jgi:hypothetical protein